VQQVDQQTERRGQSALPQFDLPQWDVDPDRTMERLPALSADRLPDYSSDLLPTLPPSRADVVTAPAVYVGVHDLDSDMARTIELVPELSSSDIIEETPSRPALPPLVLPAPVGVPIDLSRLLQRAQAEASRSPEFFHSTPAPSSVAVPPSSAAVPFLLTTEKESDPGTAVAIPLLTPHTQSQIIPGLRRPSRLAWVVGMVGAVAAVTVGIALGQARVSAARSPQSVVVTRPPPPAVVPAAPKITSNPLVPTVSVQSLPQVGVGTVSLAAVAASHRLFVDGRVAEGGSAVVKCGPHLVQVGSRGVRRMVDIPCGQEVVLDR